MTAEKIRKPYLHPPLLEGVTLALREIFGQQQYADRVLERLFKDRPKWGARDRAIVAECVYDLVRWWRLYWFLLDEEPDFHPNSLALLAGIWAMRNEVDLPALPVFRQLDPEKIRRRLKDAEKSRSIAESVPDWLDEFGIKEIGVDGWQKELHAMNRQAPIVIRVNTLKISFEKVWEVMENDGWKPRKSPLSESAIVLGKRGNLFSHPAFREGWFEIQDAGSQCIAPFLNAKPGMMIIDACCGAGGKTLHLASLVKNKGRILAMDVDLPKLEELKKRARRNGVSNVEPRLIDTTKVIKRLADRADRLLLDVPCSGSGVLRRNPDAKWKLSPEFLDEVRKKQAEILDSYSRMLKPGGEMVYATCSIFPSENENQVNLFLDSHPGFSMLDSKTILPSENDSDGFYMALVKKS